MNKDRTIINFYSRLNPDNPLNTIQYAAYIIELKLELIISNQ